MRAWRFTWFDSECRRNIYWTYAPDDAAAEVLAQEHVDRATPGAKVASVMEINPETGTLIKSGCGGHCD